MASESARPGREDRVGGKDHLGRRATWLVVDNAVGTDATARLHVGGAPRCLLPTSIVVNLGTDLTAPEALAYLAIVRTRITSSFGERCCERCGRLGHQTRMCTYDQDINGVRLFRRLVDVTSPKWLGGCARCGRTTHAASDCFSYGASW